MVTESGVLERASRAIHDASINKFFFLHEENAQLSFFFFFFGCCCYFPHCCHNYYIIKTPIYKDNTLPNQCCLLDNVLKQVLSRYHFYTHSYLYHHKCLKNVLVARKNVQMTSHKMIDHTCCVRYAECQDIIRPTNNT